MKKAIILDIVVTKNQIIPCQFEGDIWRPARRSCMLTPEESCNHFFALERLRNCDNQTSNTPVII